MTRGLAELLSRLAPEKRQIYRSYRLRDVQRTAGEYLTTIARETFAEEDAEMEYASLERDMSTLEELDSFLAMLVAGEDSDEAIRLASLEERS